MYIFLILLLIFIYINFYQKNEHEFFDSNRIKSEIDGNYYSVVAAYKDQQLAADTIANINIFAKKLIHELKYQYATQDPDTNPGTTPGTVYTSNSSEKIKGAKVYRILQNRFNPRGTSENDPPSADQTSYTKNKGEEISLCLREKQTGDNKFHSIDDLKFVMLHELAHVITPEMEHTNTFWNNFRFLLEFCEKYGLYKSKNYMSKNVVYCGLTISYNPLYDNERTYSYFHRV